MNSPAESIRRASVVLGTPLVPEDYVILKVMPVGGGCCCLHCWPETWRAVNLFISPAGPVPHEGYALVGRGTGRYVLEGHESGPEVVVYLGAVVALLGLAKGVAELVTTIMKAATEERSHSARMRIVRRVAIKGEFEEEEIVEVDLPLSEDAAGAMENAIRRSLEERGARRADTRR